MCVFKISRRGQELSENTASLSSQANNSVRLPIRVLVFSCNYQINCHFIGLILKRCSASHCCRSERLVGLRIDLLYTLRRDNWPNRIAIDQITKYGTVLRESTTDSGVTRTEGKNIYWSQPKSKEYMLSSEKARECHIRSSSGAKKKKKNPFETTDWMNIDFSLGIYYIAALFLATRPPCSHR